MQVLWRNKKEPDWIFERLRAIMRLNDDKSVSFTGFALLDNIYWISCELQGVDDFPESTVIRMTRESVFAAARNGRLDSRGFMQEFVRAANHYRARSTSVFWVATGISLESAKATSPIRTNTMSIRIGAAFTKQLELERQKALRMLERQFPSPLPNSYLPVLGRVVARGPSEALESAIDEIDLHRGIWNLDINRRTRRRLSTGAYKDPVNRIVLHPIHTVHGMNGKISGSNYLYEESFTKGVDLFDPESNEVFEKRFQKRLLKALKSKKYGSMLRSAIIRYSRALDERSYSMAFLKLWGVLEILTMTGPRDSYDVTVRRSSFVFHEAADFKQVLRHLQDHRNGLVHHDKPNSQGQMLVYELKEVVETLLRFLAFCKFDFQSHQEAISFLDLPPDVADISRRLMLLAAAKRFRTGKPL